MGDGLGMRLHVLYNQHCTVLTSPCLWDCSDESKGHGRAVRR